MTPLDDMDKAYQLIDHANDFYLKVWLDSIVFSWQWWFMVALTVLPWFAWILLRKKESSDRLLYAGLASILIASFADVLGVAYGLWSYRWDVIPLLPSFLPWDGSLFPVAIMLSFQYNPLKLNRYWRGLLFGAFSSLVVEPTFTYLDFYNPIYWKHIYSLPVIFFIYVLIDLISRKKNFEEI